MPLRIVSVLRSASTLVAQNAATLLCQVHSQHSRRTLCTVAAGRVPAQKHAKKTNDLRFDKLAGERQLNSRTQPLLGGAAMRLKF